MIYYFDDSTDPYPLVQHKFWKMLKNNDTLQSQRFLSFIYDINLHDDPLHSIKQFYQKHCHSIHSSFKYNMDILLFLASIIDIAMFLQIC